MDMGTSVNTSRPKCQSSFAGLGLGLGLLVDAKTKSPEHITHPTTKNNK
jgi:hypothetical protein